VECKKIMQQKWCRMSLIWKEYDIFKCNYVADQNCGERKIYFTI
jgi:hypothetical protein